MNIPLPIRNLANTDRKLLEAVLDSGFDFRQVVTKPTTPNAHPAQQSLMSFLLWFGQPHIKEAVDLLLALYHRMEHLATTARQARARVVLECSLNLMHSITPTSLPTHSDPVQTEKSRREAHAIARESRLIAARLTPASLLKNPDTPPRTPKPRNLSTTSPAAAAGAIPSSAHHTNAPQAASTPNSTSSTCPSLKPSIDLTPANLNAPTHIQQRDHALVPSTA